MDIILLSLVLCIVGICSYFKIRNWIKSPRYLKYLPKKVWIPVLYIEQILALLSLLFLYLFFKQIAHSSPSDNFIMVALCFILMGIYLFVIFGLKIHYMKKNYLKDNQP